VGVEAASSSTPEWEDLWVPETSSEKDSLEVTESTDLLPGERAKLQRFSSQFIDLQTALFAYLTSRTGGDTGGAEDCLQEVAMVLWKKHDPDWSAEDFRRFAYRCASIEARAWHRKRQRSGTRMVFLAPDVVETVSQQIVESVSTDPTPTQIRLEALRSCVEALNPRQRELLDIRYDDSGTGKTLAEIAAERGEKPDSFYKRLERIRSALQQCILKRLKARS